MDLVDVAGAADVAALRREVERLRGENARLSRLLDLRGQDTAPAPEQLAAASRRIGPVTMSSRVEDKLALYGELFCARADVYAVRWENTRTGVHAGGCPRWLVDGARAWIASRQRICR